jgi:hypothetical protein
MAMELSALPAGRPSFNIGIISVNDFFSKKLVCRQHDYKLDFPS